MRLNEELELREKNEPDSSGAVQVFYKKKGSEK